MFGSSKPLCENCDAFVKKLDFIEKFQKWERVGRESSRISNWMLPRHSEEFEFDLNHDINTINKMQTVKSLTYGLEEARKELKYREIVYQKHINNIMAPLEVTSKSRKNPSPSHFEHSKSNLDRYTSKYNNLNISFVTKSVKKIS